MISKQPNILLIVSDQHRKDCVGCENKYPVHTPNLDRLAQEGVRFDNAYTPIPLCCPARQAFINGRRPETFGALWNYDNGLPSPALEPTEYAWPRELHEAGYRNAYIGKWHVNPGHLPTEYGYQEYVGLEHYQRFRRQTYPDLKLKNGYMGENDPVPLEDARTHWLAKEAVDRMEEYAKQDKPWHIRLDFAEPHLPCQPSGKFAQMYNPGDIPQWEGFDETFENKPYIQKQQLYNWQAENLTWDDWAKAAARYYGVISQMDEAIGIVLDALDRIGASEDTIVIYTSDHGDMCGSHRMVDKHYVLYDDVVRVPLIIRWPGRVEEGNVCKPFVYNLLDLPPTFLEVIGREPRPHFQGRSLLDLIQGNEVEDWRECVVSTYNGQQFGLYTQRMIYDGSLKYIWNTTDIDELYDLRSDPGELINLIRKPEYAPMLKVLRGNLYEELREAGDGMVKSPWMRDQLRNGTKL